MENTRAMIVTSPETLWPFELNNRTRSPTSGRSVATTFWAVPVTAPAKARVSRSSMDVSRSYSESRIVPTR